MVFRREVDVWLTAIYICKCIHIASVSNSSVSQCCIAGVYSYKLIVAEYM